MNDQRGSGLLWALVGCGGLLFVGLCVTLGVGAYLLVQKSGSERGAGQVPAPMRPAVTPAPSQPAPPQPLPSPPTQLDPPFTLEARVTEVTGSLKGRVSSTCRFAIEQVPTEGELRCRTQIVCDSILVYGGPQAGYFPCRSDAARHSVSGSDTQTTAQDRDAAMSVDTDARTLRVEDDASGPNGAFVLTASLPATL